MASGSFPLLLLLAIWPARSCTAAKHSGSDALPRGLAASAVAADALDDGSAFVQMKSSRSPGASRSPVASTPSAPRAGQPELTSREASQARTEYMLGRFDDWEKRGVWTPGVPRLLLNGCGNSTFRELGMSIPMWQREHPGVDGFCHFANYAWWLNGQGAESVTDYKQYARGSFTFLSRISALMCGYSGEDNAGPAASMPSSSGAVRWEHLSDCMSAVDDPICYSLGWLKGQRLDGTNMSDIPTWRAKAEAECRRIQDTYHFIDEEVTVGSHVFNTPIYMQKSIRAILGTGPPVEDRIYYEHMYTMCLLGNAGASMAYCYHRGCILSDGKISKGSACNYDE
mmetsp:Transcript_79077/g.232170  ORF Transcript_79077/g.232170 Transcript_79077/m.232170 type:complete len:341 (-) Transcript_79077:46-1068(-)